MSERKNRDRRLIRYGQCLNESCEKAQSKEIQRISVRKDFVCESCGKKLYEVQPPRSWWDKNGKKTIASITGFVFVGCVAWFVATGNHNNVSTATINNQTATDTVADVNQVEMSDTVLESVSDINKTSTATVAEQLPVQTEVVSDKEISASKPARSASKAKSGKVGNPGAKLKCGVYDGPLSGEIPNGVGGNITITSSYIIDLKDGNGGTVTLEPGDRISNTKFKNGVLQQGQLIRSNGERKFMTGLSERL